MRRHPALLGLVILTATLGLVACGGTTGDQSRASPSPRLETGEARTTTNGMTSTVREVHRFNTLAELVATADAVAIITIKEVTVGSVNDPDGGVITTLSVQATVDEVLAGSLPLGDVRLAFDSAFWDPALKGTHHDWLVQDTRVLAALHKRVDNGAYRPLNSQSLFRIDDSDSLVAVWDSALAGSVDGISLAEMRRRVSDAVRQVEDGLVVPASARPISVPEHDDAAVDEP